MMNKKILLIIECVSQVNCIVYKLMNHKLPSKQRNQRKNEGDHLILVNLGSLIIMRISYHLRNKIGD